MMSYDSFNEIQQKGSYICVEPSKFDLVALKTLAKHSGILINGEDELHCTLIYSTVGIPEVPIFPERTYYATCGDLALYGPNNNCLVLELDSKCLHTRNDELMAFGFQTDYDQYKPHITLTYSEDALTLPAAHPFNGIKIELTGEKHKPLKVDEDNETLRHRADQS